MQGGSSIVPWMYVSVLHMDGGPCMQVYGLNIQGGKGGGFRETSILILPLLTITF